MRIAVLGKIGLVAHLLHFANISTNAFPAKFFSRHFYQRLAQTIASPCIVSLQTAACSVQMHDLVAVDARDALYALQVLLRFLQTLVLSFIPIIYIMS